MIPRVLIIAGSDSGGGAGIQADIKTVTMLGGHAMSAITAITAQNTLGVEDVVPIPAKAVVRQMACVAEDIGIDAVKIGMIGGADTVAAVADELAHGLYGGRIVFDPVMIATSGARLADDRTIAAMERLARLAAVVTPNLPELAVLCGVETLADEDVESAAIAFATRIGAAVLVKGGHAEGDIVHDRLVDASGVIAHWTHPRIDTRHTHGTGCTLASGIATGLAAGLPLADAVGRAIAYVQAALAAAPGLGAGHGPMGHTLGVTPFATIAATCPD
ncbi:bifunctional hydroxymethylpyrimidine kinase/phosphomethylpyrimidine kinase [Sphingomonas aquatilis]|uniref:hydroxymethylpyrimidine kinase n=1 Tax=Sphingomonas aquatilis TaxID=93063 RepID=A0AAW3TQE7_9SPHN|nr:bifunctional hydroxymethylpyrimidine kinase/phosphomethylpyrimidine kinase [Sphingomonas aquatilis]MBB3875266.1 hydroxymethylpyrimidine/phosphomethylpyrimidine kinase [Sphingomonas aquatilis]MCI4653932.1 bifunctional hydroxymethylpyrimidine kinase/phosphomethylpyrimidine kinase [Sphingomonas aquatilis]GEM72212.1 hydroxymethylpyrimidine/phosphomethylpyrimidine kinase [Sphingomonas aquatilis NBRC 16722]